MGRRTLDGLLLWAPEWADPLHMRHPAHELWVLLEAPIPAQELIEDLSFVFDAETRAAKTEVLALLDDLQHWGAVVVAEQPES